MQFRRLTYGAAGFFLSAMVTHCATGTLDAPATEMGTMPGADAGDAPILDPGADGGGGDDTGTMTRADSSSDSSTGVDAARVTTCPPSWASPTSSATCRASGCGVAPKPPCQPNGCFGGYWCDSTATPRCRSTPPSGC